INAPSRYYELSEAYSVEKDPKKKEEILLEMMHILPKHKGSEREFGYLRRRLSLLRKQSSRKSKKHRAQSIRKLWPRVCLLGYDKGDILSRFKMTVFEGILYGVAVIDDMHIQLVYMKRKEDNQEVFNQSDIIISDEDYGINDKFCVVSEKPDISSALKQFGVIRVYTEDSKDAIPIMRGSSIRDLAEDLGLKVGKRSHAEVYGRDVKFQGQSVSLDYVLKDGDRVFIKT
ncbi:MAG: TGS domain-containing protein, partial [Candidatus Parvarchaeota archaeon]|nr:TGS domain-containing protein [Candidatus Parvarchaeota archaeon]